MGGGHLCEICFLLCSDLLHLVSLPLAILRNSLKVGGLEILFP